MKAIEYNVEVSEKGRVEFYVPFPAGSHIRLFILEKTTDDSFDDLPKAADSRADFRDNPFDNKESLLQELELKNVEQSADLYAEIYEEDTELQELTSR